MKIAFYMNCVSAHQLPLAKEVIALVGKENFRYVDAGERSESMQSVKGEDLQGCNIVRLDEGQEWLENADLVLTGIRDLDLFQRRAKRGLKTLYASERWFKPLTLFDLRLFDCLIHATIPGWVRMMVPGYRRMVKRFVKWMNGDPGAKVLSIGPWAKRDFLRMGVRAEKIQDWGYFVAAKRAQSESKDEPTSPNQTIKQSNNQTIFRILWGGRMLALKNVDVIIRAVGVVARNFKDAKIELTLVGDGPEKPRLVRLAAKIKQSSNQTNLTISFLLSQSPDSFRALMRQHGLFVFPSNGFEGWGAVVSEALEEGMSVLGSADCGAPAALLPKERLFPCRDWQKLAVLVKKEMSGELPPCGIGEWTAKAGARKLVNFCKDGVAK